METLPVRVRWRSLARSPSPSSSPSRRSLPAILQVVQYLGTITTCQGCHMAFPLRKNLAFFFLVFVVVRPPGSQEECWHLQIVAKGRVPCPKCKSVSRKTVEGLKKHMENCRLVSTQQFVFKSMCWLVRLWHVWDGSPLFLGQQPFTCQHCGKQLKSSTGMKYHIMADHSQLVRALGPARFFLSLTSHCSVHHPETALSVPPL